MKQPEARTGRYVKQITGYKAFLPAPLPPAPPLTFDNELWRLLSDADRALGRLDGVTQTLPDTDLYLMMYVRKEALFSSQIEGTQASLDDIIEHEDAIENADNPKDVEEVINYVRALNHGLVCLERLPLSLRLFRDIHRILMQGVRGEHRNPGEFRETQNWIGPPGSTVENAAFVPPPPHELQHYLGELETFIHSDSPLPLLCQIGLAHAQFETIHPFLDGNGRLGRLLITFLLCEREILATPSLYISHYFTRHKSEYYARLQATRDEGDWEGWLKFFLRGVREVALEGAHTAGKIMGQREEHRALVSSRLSHAHAGSAFKLIEQMYRTPVISTNRAAQIIGRTYTNARQIVLELVELGLLEEITGQLRNQRYRYSPYVNLFRSEP